MPNILAKLKRFHSFNTLKFNQFFKIHIQQDTDIKIQHPYHYNSYLNQLKFNQKPTILSLLNNQGVRKIMLINIKTQKPRYFNNNSIPQK